MTYEEFLKKKREVDLMYKDVIFFNLENKDISITSAYLGELPSVEQMTGNLNKYYQTMISEFIVSKDDSFDFAFENLQETYCFVLGFNTCKRGE
jgi:hypothetical protein